MRPIVQRLLIAIALVASAVFFIPAPAQAGGYWIKICSFIELPGGIIVPDDCHWVEIPILEPEGPWPPGCEVCFPAFDIWEDFIDPVVVDDFNEYFNKGFGLLAESRLTEDPGLAKELREASVEYFFSAAEVIEKYEIALDSVGWVDEKSGEFFDHPDTQPLLNAFGKELAAGTRAFQALAIDPQPETNIDDALAHYDAALEAITKTGSFK
jgi:hypothetical protein